jgi:tripartite-type tricarboxylate transporter receptor subunit TctC
MHQAVHLDRKPAAALAWSAAKPLADNTPSVRRRIALHGDSEVSGRSILGAVACAVSLSAILLGGLSAAAADFYAGKTVTIIVSGGGAYETYGRLFAQYLPKYIPGHPTMIVQSMPGGGGIRAATFLYKIAPRDGTYIGGVHGAVLTAPFLAPSVTEFDVTRFSWLGNATRDTFVGYVWHTSPTQSIEDARTRQLVVGGTSVGGNGIDTAILLKEIFGFKLKIVSGYKNSNETKIALERGEIEATLANAYSSLSQTDWLSKKLVRIIIQHGFRKHRALPDVPLSRDLARNQTERQMVDLLNVRDEITRPYVAPPGVPADRVTVLRRAFEQALHDPALLTDVQHQQLEIEDPSNGEELTGIVERIAKTPPSVVQALVTMFNNYKDGR